MSGGGIIWPFLLRGKHRLPRRRQRERHLRAALRSVFGPDVAAVSLDDAAREAIDLIERAIEKRQVLTIDYSDEAGRGTARDIRPLGLWFWGKVWTLVAWCEMRDDFRAFRIDRIASVVIAGRIFKPERGKQLADFYRAVERSEDYGMAPDRVARS